LCADLFLLIKIVLAEFLTSFFYVHFGLVKFYLMFFKTEFQDFFNFFLNYIFGLSFFIIFCLTISTIVIQKLEGSEAKENWKSLEEDMWTGRP
jgi:amino acid permease